MNYSTIISCVLIVSVAASSKLPATFKKCNRHQHDFKQCLLKAVEDAVGQLNKPFKDVGLPSLEPIVVPSMVIAPGTGAVKFQQKYNNLKGFGFSKGKFTKFDVNFDKKTIELESIFPEIKMVFEYDFNGQILVLPFYGKGPGTITIDELKFDFTFELDEYEKHGAKYFKIIKSRVVFTPRLIKFKFDNLFNGDEKLGQNVNQVFNDNWKGVFEDVKESYEDAYGQIFAAIFGNLLRKVPISELFGE